MPSLLLLNHQDIADSTTTTTTTTTSPRWLSWLERGGGGGRREYDDATLPEGIELSCSSTSSSSMDDSLDEEVDETELVSHKKKNEKHVTFVLSEDFRNHPSFTPATAWSRSNRNNKNNNNLLLSSLWIMSRKFWIPRNQPRRSIREHQKLQQQHRLQQQKQRLPPKSVLKVKTAGPVRLEGAAVRAKSP